MVQLQAIFKTAYWSLAAFGGIYAAVLLCLTNPTAQRYALYMHKAQSERWSNLDTPDRIGFAKNQITPFYLTTPDGEELYGWHVLPLGSYSRHEVELQKQEPWPPTSFSSSLAYKLLLEDPEARVVINFHGNAGHVGQGYRPHTYKSVTSSNSKIHVFTVDYRGFGRSTGVPSEAGLIMDGVTLVNYVISLGIPSDRIILLGQSLGTQVASAVALHFADSAASYSLLPGQATDINLHGSFELAIPRSEPTDFAAVILAASFPSVKRLLTVYRLSGLVPLLSPLRVYPYLQNFLLRFIRENWETSHRLSALASAAAQPGRKLRLHILHARDDYDINWKMGEENFQAAERALANATGAGVETSATGKFGETERTDVWVGEDKENARVRVIWELLMSGGHNRIVSDAPVALAVLRGFEFA